MSEEIGDNFEALPKNKEYKITNDLRDAVRKSLISVYEVGDVVRLDGSDYEIAAKQEVAGEVRYLLRMVGCSYFSRVESPMGIVKMMKDE